MTESVPPEARLESLVSHYKDTYEIHLLSHGNRNWLFFSLLCCFALFLVNFKDTSLIQEILKWMLDSKKEICDKISPFISVLLWISLMGITVRYFQICLHVERQYKYLHVLEDEINSCFPTGSKAFTREGKFYVKDYPLFSNWMWFSFTWLFPATLMVAALFRLPVDLLDFGNTHLGFACLFSCYIIEISCFSYLCEVHGFFVERLKKNWICAVILQSVVFLALAGVSVLFFKWLTS